MTKNKHQNMRVEICIQCSEDFGEWIARENCQEFVDRPFDHCRVADGYHSTPHKQCVMR